MDSVEQNWSLTNVRIKANLKGFDGRIVYQIKADEGEFVVKIRNDLYSEREIERELFIFDFLQSKDISFAPALLKCREGSSFCRLPEGVAFIYHFIKGEKPPPSTNNYRKLGKLTATLHQIDDYPHLDKWSMSDVIGHIITDRMPLLPSEIRAEFLQIAETLCVPDNVSLCLVHGDVSLSNSIQTPSGELVLIDWDGSATNSRISDVGYPLLQFVSKDLVFDDEGAEAFYRAYFSIQKLSDKEFGYLFDAALLPALNFILFGSVDENWAKIKWAFHHREWLMEKIDKLRY